MSRLISRDPFARQELHRTVTENIIECHFCGQKRTVKGKARGLYRYSTESDGGRRSDHRGLFCSKSCHDAYHG